MVDDDVSLYEELTERLLLLPNTSVDLAISKTSAEVMISDGYFDAIVLDLNIPTTDGGLDLSIEHGRSVFYSALTKCPGTPILFLTASSAEPLFNDMLAATDNLDVWGSGEQIKTVQLWQKGRVIELVEELTRYAAIVSGTDEIEIITGGVKLDLPPERKRVLRVLARRFEGQAIRVAPAVGGLSSATVLRVTVVDKQAKPRLYAIGKLGPDDAILEERERAKLLNRLNVGAYAPLVDVVVGGARSHAGAFYRLAEGYDNSLFSTLQSKDDDAATLVSRVEESLLPWFNAATVAVGKIGDIRREYISDDKYSEIRDEFGLHWVDGVETRALHYRCCIAHGDLHGSNILTNASLTPVLIDFGDVGLTSAAKDPVTLELSVFSHPDAKSFSNGWFGKEAWQSAAFALHTQRPLFAQRCREWSRRAAYGDLDFCANAMGYCLRQLKYPDTDKDVFLALLQSLKGAFDS